MREAVDKWIVLRVKPKVNFTMTRQSSWYHKKCLFYVIVLIRDFYSDNRIITNDFSVPFFFISRSDSIVCLMNPSMPEKYPPLFLFSFFMCVCP